MLHKTPSVAFVSGLVLPHFAGLQILMFTATPAVSPLWGEVCKKNQSKLAIGSVVLVEPSPVV